MIVLFWRSKHPKTGQNGPKFEIFAEISDFRQIFRFSPNFQIFAEISDFRRNLRFWSCWDLPGVQANDRNNTGKHQKMPKKRSKTVKTIKNARNVRNVENVQNLVRCARPPPLRLAYAVWVSSVVSSNFLLDFALLSAKAFQIHDSPWATSAQDQKSIQCSFQNCSKLN